MKNNAHIAESVGSSMSLSDKQVREVVSFIKGMNIDKAIKRLEGVIEHKEAIPFKRFKIKMGHKHGMMVGRYPEKTCKALIIVLKNLKNNAINKGLQEEKVIIKEAVTMKDISDRRRIRARKGGYTGSMKLSSIKLIAAEVEKEKKEKKKFVKKEVKKK